MITLRTHLTRFKVNGEEKHLNSNGFSVFLFFLIFESERKPSTIQLQFTIQSYCASCFPNGNFKLTITEK